LVAEGIRRALFNEVKLVYPSPPSKATIPPEDNSVTAFAETFLDAAIPSAEGSPQQSLRTTLAHYFVYPIAREAELVSRGGRLGDETPMSAILFGPPGTSKTELAKVISRYLNWPLLAVDPSYLVQQGVDRIQAMANKLFSMLVLAEQIVVLLDEFDEMGRSRVKNEDLLSRFITTAMLPKLAAINKERKIVFLLATNYVSGFDAAFSRGGRFDMLVPVMQPSLDAKLNADPTIFPNWADSLKGALKALPTKAKNTARARISELTFLETKVLVHQLAGLAEAEEIEGAIQKAWGTCTLQKPNSSKLLQEGAHRGVPDPSPTWQETSLQDAKEYTRLPPVLNLSEVGA
jgi:hypothetical protein